MAKFKFNWEGLNEYIEKIDKLGNTQGFIKRAVYDGGAVMRQAILTQVEGLQVGKGGHVTEVQKQGLLTSLGFTKMKTADGKTYTKLGFDGYNADGQPNPMIANIVNSGTSKYKATHFIDKAIRASKEQVYQAMEQRLDADIETTMKGK